MLPGQCGLLICFWKTIRKEKKVKGDYWMKRDDRALEVADMTEGAGLEEAVPGTEFGPLEYVFTPEKVRYYCEAVEDLHPWYLYEIEDSPFGGPVVPPIMYNQAKIDLWTKYFPGKPENSHMHIMYNCEFFDPARVGEKITMQGKILANYMKRGRRYVDSEYDFYGEDGRKIAHYLHSILITIRKEGE